MTIRWIEPVTETYFISYAFATLNLNTSAGSSLLVMILIIQVIQASEVENGLISTFQLTSRSNIDFDLQFTIDLCSISSRHQPCQDHQTGYVGH